MLTENEKRRMSERCGFAEDQRTDDIKEIISKSAYDKDEENALSRKMHMFEMRILKLLYKEIFGEELQADIIDRFVKYNDVMERCIVEGTKLQLRKDNTNE